MNNNSLTTCPACGAKTSGKFCAECGVALQGANCRGCGEGLAPGAKFCHHCGVGSNSAAPVPSSVSPDRALLPWIVAGTAVLAVVVLVAIQKGSGAPPAGSSMVGGGPFSGGGVVQAPDISSMTPRERADRLYDRVMRLSSEGKNDSAAFFATMAVGAYSELNPIDSDLRYDYGRMAEVSGDLALAQAQADAILATSPNHLLGLLLSFRVAQKQDDSRAQRTVLDKMKAAQQTEFARNLEEYNRHRTEIEAAISGAPKTP